MVNQDRIRTVRISTQRLATSVPATVLDYRQMQRQATYFPSNSRVISETVLYPLPVVIRNG